MCASSRLSVCYGSAVMCGAQAGESLLTAGGRRRGGCRDVRTPCKPPICTSWNICRTGTSHLKGVQETADTTERSSLQRTRRPGRRVRRCPGRTKTRSNTAAAPGCASRSGHLPTGRRLHSTGAVRGGCVHLGRLSAAVEFALRRRCVKMSRTTGALLQARTAGGARGRTA